MPTQTRMKETRRFFPKALSRGEEEFYLHCRAHHLTAEREFHFALPRKWRFDFAFPVQQIAVEIEGGTWNGGRHTRGSGFAKDLEKYNHAVLKGWRVLRYTPEMVTAGTAIHDVLKLVL